MSGAKNFEDTVMSLAAAIHLLNTRLGKPEGPQIELLGIPMMRFHKERQLESTDAVAYQ